MKMQVRAVFILIIALATMGLVNCGHYTCGATFGTSSCTSGSPGLNGGGTGTTISAANASTLMYSVSLNTVAAAGFSGSTFAALSSYTAPTLPSNFADNMTIVNKKFVYIPTGDLNVQAFAITRSSGALTAIAGSPFSVPSGTGTTDGAWADPLGHFLFVGSEASGDVWAFTIDSQTGALTLVAGSPFTTGLSSADIMTVDASGNFLYVGQGLSSVPVAAFSINQATGFLNPIGTFALGVAQIRATPTGEFLLGVAEIQDAGGGSSAADPHIYVYSINPVTGIPTVLAGGSIFSTVMAPFDFAISPNGKYVYTVGTTVGTATLSPIEGFSIDSTTGALTSLGAAFASLPLTSQCQFDQAGTALVCFESSQMSVLTASPTTGNLTHAADLTTPSFPFAVTD